MNAKLVAITHLPSPRMSEALRTFIDVEPIDLARVTAQHLAYRAVLARAGAEVLVLDGNLAHPDAVFVEDTAIVLDEVAIITRMGAGSRRDEPRTIAATLRRYRGELVQVEAPGTLEGGDVLRVGRTLFVGVTARTNADGRRALADVGARFGYTVRPVRVSGCLHLKTACTALPDGTLLVNPRWVAVRDLEGSALLHVADDEPDAANVVLVNERVVTGDAHPQTVARIRARGFDVETVALDEVAKAEGCGTCLSILVPLFEPRIE